MALKVASKEHEDLIEHLHFQVINPNGFIAVGIPDEQDRPVKRLLGQFNIHKNSFHLLPVDMPLQANHPLL